MKGKLFDNKISTCIRLFVFRELLITYMHMIGSIKGPSYPNQQVIFLETLNKFHYYSFLIRKPFEWSFSKEISLIRIY